MSDPHAPSIKNRDTPQWSLYQREQFWKANDGEVPLFNTREHRITLQLAYAARTNITTDPDKLEELARKKLSENGW